MNALTEKEPAVGPVVLTEPPGVTALAVAGADSLPEVLEDPTVYRIDPHHYRIISTPREWIAEASAVHVHREVATAFYRAIPPRPVPWGKRLFWRVVLPLVGSSLGKRLLLALRR